MCCCRQHTYANSEGLILFTPLPCSEIIMMCVGSLIFILTSSFSLFLTHITYIVVHFPLLVSTSIMTRTYAGHSRDVQLILLNMTVDRTPSSYSNDAGFESKPGDRLLYLRVSWSVSVPPGKHCFIPYCINYLFITRHSYYNLSSFHLVLTLRRLMSYIYGAPILDVSRSHITTQHSR